MTFFDSSSPGTLEGLSGMLDRAANLENGTTKILNNAGEGGVTKLWVSHGTADHVCNYDGTKKWFDSINVDAKEFKAYEGWYHKRKCAVPLHHHDLLLINQQSTLNPAKTKRSLLMMWLPGY